MVRIEPSESPVSTPPTFPSSVHDGNMIQVSSYAAALRQIKSFMWKEVPASGSCEDRSRMSVWLVRLRVGGRGRLSVRLIVRSDGDGSGLKHDGLIAWVPCSASRCQ